LKWNYSVPVIQELRQFIIHAVFKSQAYKILLCHLKETPHIQTCSDERYKDYTTNSNPSQYTDVGERFSAFSSKVTDILSHGIYYEAPSKPYKAGFRKPLASGDRTAASKAELTCLSLQELTELHREHKFSVTTFLFWTIY
jgi:hypothetical protein